MVAVRREPARRETFGRAAWTVREDTEAPRPTACAATSHLHVTMQSTQNSYTRDVRKMRQWRPCSLLAEMAAIQTSLSARTEKKGSGNHLSIFIYLVFIISALGLAFIKQMGLRHNS